jgi:DNA-binding response OmpR family regulator
MRNADVVLGKSAILHAVWDEAFEGDVNNVEIYISYLRRKIDLPFGRTSIRTVRGAGYVLAGDGG